MYNTHRWDVGKLDPKYGSLKVKVPLGLRGLPSPGLHNGCDRVMTS